MYGNESSAVDEDCPVGPILTTPSKVAEHQKQQRTLEYLLKMNRHKRSDKVSSPEEIFDTENNHVSISNSENDVISSKVLNTLCQEHDKSGDWKDCNEAWKVQGPVQPKLPNSCKMSTADWKCRNLYSMSNSHRYSGSWNTGYADVTESLQEELAKDRDQNLLFNIRDYLAGYQETHGTPRTEYSFAALISIMGQTTGRALLALFYIVVNIAPVAEVFLYILRFVLDKVINIIYTPDKQQIFVKYLVLGLQLLTIYICLMFIFGFIITPIIYMVIEILTKIMLLS